MEVRRNERGRRACISSLHSNLRGGERECCGLLQPTISNKSIKTEEGIIRQSSYSSGIRSQCGGGGGEFWKCSTFTSSCKEGKDKSPHLLHLQG